jgi:hypothetical protein
MVRVAARVGTVAMIPRGYITADCAECGVAVWVRDEWDGVAEALGIEERILCAACFERSVAAEGRPSPDPDPGAVAAPSS